MVIRRKLGGSHVGFILSFAIFVIFIIFLFIIIAPANKRKGERDFILDKLNDDIVENVTGGLTIVGLRIDTSFAEPSPLENCFSIVNFKDEIGGNLGSYVRSEKIENPTIEVKAKLETNNLIVNWQEINWNDVNDKRFFKLYFSDFITDDPAACTANNIVPKDNPDTSTEGYIITSINQENYIFVNNLIKLSDEYENNYDSLKERFGVPVLLDFWFNFTDADAVPPIMVAPEKNFIPESEEVYVKELPLNYVDEQANINRGVLIVKMW